MTEQVICIRDDWRHGRHTINRPVKGCVYTIRDYVSLPHGVFYRLEEVRNPPLYRSFIRSEPVFDSDWFRPTRKTNIDQFRVILRQFQIRTDALRAALFDLENQGGA